MKVNKDDLLTSIEFVLKMDKGPIKRLEWDAFKTSVLMYNTFGRCVESVYIGTAGPTNIMLIVSARASSLKGGN